MMADLWTTPIVNGSGTGKDNCSVELLGVLIYGDKRHGWRLPCIDRGAQTATVTVNDRTSVEAKTERRWRLLVARLGTCHYTGNDRVARRMALWAARSVEHLASDPAVKACNDTLERWLAGEASDRELGAAFDDAIDAAYTAGDTADASDAAAALADAYATDAAVAADASAYTDNAAAAYAVRAVVYGSTVSSPLTESDDVLMNWLDRYLMAWSKVAADEGCMAPEDQEAEYLAFVESLDFLTGAGHD